MRVNHSKKHCSSLQMHVDGYLQNLAMKGYSLRTQIEYRYDISRFMKFSEQHGINSAKKFSTSAGNLIPVFPHSKSVHVNIRKTVNRFIEYLVQKGLVPDPPKDKPKARYDQLIEEYVQFQIDHRGVCLEYIRTVRRVCKCFMAYLQKKGVRRLAFVKPAIVLDFIAEEGKKYNRKTVSTQCSVLRSFLKYLYRKDRTRRDLGGVVISPRIYKDESCPRFLTTNQIQTVLLQVDRATHRGMRDYAMILLLATYGLRGIEVFRLCLDDIDWRNNLIYIRARKAGNNTVYPLSPLVSEAIIQYLKKSRPQSKERQIFLTTNAPYKPLASTVSLSVMLRKYMKAAGIKVAKPGTHTFRYSCAQLLLNKGTPLKIISDYLGHVQPETTRQYIKIAIEDLREVARNDGEEAIL